MKISKLLTGLGLCVASSPRRVPVPWLHESPNRTDYEEKGMGPFYPFDSPTPMGYWELPGGVLENPNDLKVWIDKAVAVATAASLKKKPRVKRG